MTIIENSFKSQLPIIEQGDLFSYVCEILVLISPSTLWVILFKRGANCYFHLSFKGGPYGLQVTCCHVVHRIFFCIMCVVGTKALYYNNCLLLRRLLEKVDEILTKKNVLYHTIVLFCDENSTFILRSPPNDVENSKYSKISCFLLHLFVKIMLGSLYKCYLWFFSSKIVLHREDWKDLIKTSIFLQSQFAHCVLEV